MEIKVKFKAIKYHGGICTFVENIDVPDDLTTVDQQDNYVNELDKSDIMDNHELHMIVDFWRYVKKPKGEKKPSWKEVAAKWEKACEIAQETASIWEGNYNEAKKSSAIWEQNSIDWKKIALDYKLYLKKYVSGQSLRDLPVIEDSLKANSLETGEPVNITNGYNGGWLAPNGDFYGMDGEYMDMIHNQLAYKIQELGLIPEDKDRWHNPDSWLSDNGWTKIHNDWILYDGYQRAKRELPVIKMTDEQRKQIALYGTECCNGVLSVGLEKKRLTPTMFLSVEAPMIWKLFDF